MARFTVTVEVESPTAANVSHSIDAEQSQTLQPGESATFGVADGGVLTITDAEADKNAEAKEKTAE